MVELFFEFNGLACVHSFGVFFQILVDGLFGPCLRGLRPVYGVDELQALARIQRAGIGFKEFGEVGFGSALQGLVPCHAFVCECLQAFFHFIPIDALGIVCKVLAVEVGVGERGQLLEAFLLFHAVGVFCVVLVPHIAASAQKGDTGHCDQDFPDGGFLLFFWVDVNGFLFRQFGAEFLLFFGFGFFVVAIGALLFCLEIVCAAL